MSALVDAGPRDAATERAARAARGSGRRGATRLTGIGSQRLETIAVFVGFAAVYTALGQWLVREAHVVGFETLARFHRALVVALDPGRGPTVLADDPGPLATLLTVPLTVAPAALSSFVVVPVLSAVFASATMVVLHGLMRRAGVGAPTRLVGLLAVGFNPLVLLYAADGDRLFVGLCFALGALSALLAWHSTSDPRFVLASGLAFGLAVMSSYEMLAWLVVTVVVVAATKVRLGATGDEVGSTTVALALPTAAALGLWVLLGLVLTGRPFSWLAAVGRDPLGTGATGDRLPVPEALEHTGTLVVHGAPLALLVLPALLHAWLVRRDAVAGVLAAVLGAVVLLPGTLAALGRSGPPLLRESVPMLLVAAVAAVWLGGGRAATRGSRRVGLLALLVAVAGIPWTARAMTTYDQQVLEAGFVDALSTGRSQEGRLTAGGAQVGYASEAAMGRFLAARVSGPGTVLTDGSATYAVLLRAGDADLFRDRLRLTPAAWEALVRDSGARGVTHLLLSTDPRRDLLSRRFPETVSGRDPRLPVVYRTPRYVLVEVDR